MSTAKHTASGQAAGYLFQPDRALYWLARSEKGSVIGIETADDVTVVSENGDITIREQDKNSIQEEGQPIKDRSNDLWNTLFIWVKALENNEFDTEKVQLFFATNKAIPENAIVKKIAETDGSNVEPLMALLKTAIKNSPAGIKEKVEYVLSKEDLLRQLIPKIKLSDDNNPSNLDDKIISQLHLIDETSGDILIYLKGWVHDCITKLWDSRQPGIINRDAFDTILNNAKFRYNSIKLRERVKRFVQEEINDELVQKNQDAIFVKQLEAITTSEDDLMVDAIDDYLCADIERTRLILAGEITKDDFIDFDDKCVERWKAVRIRNNRQVNLIVSDAELPKEDKENKLKTVGFYIYDQTACTGYHGVLAGYQTTESYLTKGTFYLLSDTPVIGWHPEWQVRFTKNSDDENS
jgi:hypothetical protein